MLCSYLLGDNYTDIVFLQWYFGPWIIYFLIGVNAAFYWKEVESILKNNLYIKITIAFLFVISFVALPYFVTQTYPQKPAIWIITNIVTISFLLMVFTQKKITISTLNNNTGEYNSDLSLSQMNFEGKLFGYVSKFFWFNGQYSLGLFISHRVFMKLVPPVILNLFGLNILPWQEGITRFEAFGLSILYFILVYLTSLLANHLIWKIPKVNLIYGRKPIWLSVKDRKVISSINTGSVKGSPS